MPSNLSPVAAEQYAALIADEGMTSRVRTLSKAIVEHAALPAANWLDDLTALGFAVPSESDKRETFAKKLGASFGYVANESCTDGVKRAARVSIIDVPAVNDDKGNETSPATVEVAVAFRAVKPKSKSS